MRIAQAYLVGLLSCVSASPSHTWRRRAVNARNSSACAEVSASAASTLSASPSATPTVAAQLAYDCLNSVPLHKKEALELFDSLQPYIEWQSDIEYLKNPPSGYLEPAVDLPSAFANIRSKLDGDEYANEYSYQADLFKTYNLAHDGHFRFFPDLLTSVLRFSRNVGLVSVSLNGTETPKIYVHDDIDNYNAGNSTTISSVDTINGEEAVKFLEDLSQLGALNDPDALYNALFFSKPFAASTPGWNGYFSGSGRFGFIYTGSNTTIGFKNGTSRTYAASSQVLADFSGVTDGESAYQKFCTGPADETADALAATSTVPSSSPTASPAPGYPIPDIVSSDHVVSGYFLNSSRNSDVAVLSMISFEPEVPAEFQQVVQQFLVDAKAAGKKKIVIDVSANGGGYILSGYDTYRQFFPQIEQDGFTRFRYTEALAVMAEQFAVAIPANYTPETADGDTINAYESFVNYRYDLDINDKHFTSVSDKIGPHEYNNDNFTSIIRWGLNDPITTTNSTFGIGMEITGYGTRRNFTQPFAPEDIIILYDGYCASTCTLFSEFMRLQGGVKSIAVGGRPSTGPMQGIGGVKGANNAGYDYLWYLAQYAYESGTPDQQQWSNWTSLTDLTLLPVNRSTDTSINLRDNILRDNLKEGLPSQFVYEKADCRLFYEPRMISDISYLWEAAADAAWNARPCIEGGLSGNKTRSLRMDGRVGLGARKTKPKMRLPKGNFKVAEKSDFWQQRHGMKVPQ